MRASIGAIFRYLTDWSIATKILSLVLAVSSIFVAVGVVGLLTIHTLNTQQTRQYESNVVALSRMTAIRAAVGLQQEAVLSHILSEAGFYRGRYETVIAETDKIIDSNVSVVRRIGLSPTETDSLNVFENTMASWRGERDAALNASRLGDRKQATSIVLVRSAAVEQAVISRADSFLAQLVAAVAARAKESQTVSHRATNWMLIALVVGGLIAIILSTAAARTISRPTREAVDILARVAAGDFTKRMRVSRRDEMGQMGKSLNDTLVTLRDAFDSLTHQALHDNLTGLANRALLRERLLAAMPTDRRDRTIAMLLIDLDGFKQVNDVHGHAAGDQMLVAVAIQLSAVARPGDTVCRLGGDEFAVLIEGVVDDADASAIAERMMHEIQTPVPFGDIYLMPRASIGIATWCGQSDGDELIRDADAAMYSAKASGKGTIVQFSPDGIVTRPAETLKGEARTPQS